MATKVDQFIADLNGGVLEEQLSAILSEVASAVVDHGRKGEVTLKLDIKKLGEGHQVQIEHTLKYKRPTMRGSRSEDSASTTPMHVGSKGALTFFPENQTTMFDKKGNVASE